MNPQTNPTPGQAAFDQGVALLNKGQQEQGEACLQEAARLGHPFAAKAIIETRLAHKVISLAQAGQRNLAETILEDARWQPSAPSDQLVAQLRELLKQFKDGQFVQPTNKEGWLNMGVTLIEAGKQKHAVYCFQKAIDLDSHYEMAWLNLGLAFSKFNEFENGLLVYDRLLTIKPDSFHGWNFKGMTLGNLQKQEEAVACYDRALKLKPDLAEAWFNKSLALGHLQRQDESVSCCDRVLALDPRHLDALLQKARALHRLGRDDEARACGEQMLRIDPVATSKLLNKT